jgi:hypothetical protein
MCGKAVRFSSFLKIIVNELLTFYFLSSKLAPAGGLEANLKHFRAKKLRETHFKFNCKQKLANIK